MKDFTEVGRAGSPHDLSKRGTSIGLLVCSCLFALILDGSDVQMLAVTAPLIAADWGLAHSALGPALAAALAGMMLGGPIGGLLGDRWGRRPVTLACMIGFGCLTIAVGQANNLGQIIAVRFLAGIAFGALYPNIFTLVAENAQPAQRARVVLLVAVGIPLGGMFGAIATAWAITMVGWRTCFYTGGAITLLFALVLFRILPESVEFLSRSGRSDALPGSRLRAATQPAADGDARARRGTSRISALFAGPYRLRTLSLWLLMFSVSYGGYSYLHWIPTLLTMAGLSLRVAIVGSSVLNLFAIIATLLSAWLTPRLGSRRSILTSLALFTIGTVALGLIFKTKMEFASPAYILAIMAALAASGLGMGGGMSGSALLSIHLYSVENRATGGGFATALGRFGAVSAAIGGGWVLAAEDPFMGFVLTAQAVQHDADLVFGREMAPGLPPDILHHLLRRGLRRRFSQGGFGLHLRLLERSVGQRA